MDIKEIDSTGEKTSSWIKDKAIQIANNTFGVAALSKQKDKLCWKYYNGTVDDDDYEYLNKEGGSYLPAKVRSMNILRTPVNLLVSHQSRRKLVFDIYVDDKDGKNEKYNNQIRKFLNSLYSNIIAKRSQIELQLTLMSIQMQELQQVLQKEPETEEEMAQIQMLQQQMPFIQQQIGLIEKQYNEALKDNDREIEKIKRLYIKNYKDTKEELAEQALLELIKTMDIADKSLDGFIDRIVTGKQYMLADIDEETKELIYENYNALHVYYPSSTTNKFVQLEKWIALQDITTLEDCLMLYGDTGMMTADVIEDLKSYSYTSMNFSTSDLYHGQATNAGVNRTIVYFRAPIKKVKRTTSNKVELISLKEARENKVEGAKDEIRYDEEIFKAVVLNNKHVVYAKKKEYVYRDPMTKRLWLPVVGETFSGIYRQPFSLIWQNKDFQEMYRIINHYKELMVAVAGVKGQIVDLSQIPSDMTPTQHRHTRKKGTLYIETLKKGGQNSPYNQWKEFDDSISPSIQYVETMLSNIIETCFMLMGVPRQRLGIMVHDERVGNAQLATEQSALVTEILHNTHDTVISQSYKLLLNLYAEYKNDEDVIIYSNKESRYGQGIKLPKNIFKDRKFDIHCLNTMKNETQMEELKMLAMQHYQKNAMALHDAVSFYNSDTLRELESGLREWSERAEQLSQSQQQQQMDKMEEIERMKIELPKQIEAQMKEATNQIEMYKVKLDEARLQLEQQKVEMDNQIKKYDIDTNKELKMTEMASEREVESSYLNEQNRASKQAEKLQSIQLEISAMKLKIDAMLGQMDNRNKTKALQAKKSGKEHLKDN